MTKSVARLAMPNQQSYFFTSDDNVPGTIVSSLSKQCSHGVHKAMMRNCELRMRCSTQSPPTASAGP